VPLAVARLRVAREYETAVTAIGLTLVRQPLHKLQRIGVGASPTFLYDDSWMHDNLSGVQLAARGGAVELYPGVAWSLARLSGLLKPALEVLWVDDVRRWNKNLVAHVPDIAGHLFGRDRVSLAPARTALLEAYGAECFYCRTSVGPSAPVDHVVPWSRVGIDGLANLVVACGKCNGNKGQSLPAPRIVERVVARDRNVLERLAMEIKWPTQHDRLVAAARGLYRGQAPGTPMWSAFGRTTAVDLAWSPGWLLDLTCG
jgi:5-methylcytosine-specific restriction endonuclease McrA